MILTYLLTAIDAIFCVLNENVYLNVYFIFPTFLLIKTLANNSRISSYKNMQMKEMFHLCLNRTMAEKIVYP